MTRVGDGDDRRCPAVDRGEDRGLAVGGEGVGRVHEFRGVDAHRGQEARAPHDDGMAGHRGRHAATRDGEEVGRVGDGELPGVGGLADDGVGERMLRAALRGGDESEDLLLGERTLGADDVRHAGLALGQGAGLVEHDGLDRAQPLERLGVAEQDPVLGALAGADHDRGGGREAEGAGAGDDQHGDRVEQREVERGLRPEREPDHEREGREGQDRGHEVAR